jgi:ribosome-associated protein
MNKIDTIISALERVNAQDIDVFDMRNTSPFFDFLIIASVKSNRQLQASFQHISDDLVKKGYPAPSIEGKQSNSWVLIDARDVIINVFTPEERSYYDLEKMLADVKRWKVDELHDI